MYTDTTQKNTDTVMVTISDNGIGMSNEELARIYEKFYQADSSRESSGNGLGMALVKRIIDLHCGKIDISSEKTTGLHL